MYRVFAEVTMVAHLAYLVFVVFGGFLAWHWPRVIVAHLMAVGWGAAIVAAGPNCPLTYVEDRLRRRAGQPGLPGGFIDTYIEGVLYPTQYAGQVRMLAGAVILVSWLGGYLLARRARRHASPNMLSHVDSQREGRRPAGDGVPPSPTPAPRPVAVRKPARFGADGATCR